MVYIDKNSKESLYMQIYTQIKNEILNGVLKDGDILAGSRGLAKILNVSRNTVDNAYAQLLAEGYIIPKKGVGYSVVKLPEINVNLRNDGSHNTIIVPRNEIDEQPQDDILYDLTNSSYTSDLFPKKKWKRFTIECLEMLEAEAKISAYQNKQGELYLRRNLLLYLERIRGVNCKEDQIIITCGIQQSLDYLCKILSNKKGGILVEEPGFNKAMAVFYNNDLNIYTVPVDDNGIVVSALPEMLNPCALYLTPSHQFPTGVTLSVGRRYELLKWAQRNETYIIEDDFDSELRYYSKPIPSLQSIDTENRVIYIGTFSKALSPSIRMGYMILPPQLLHTYLLKFENYNSTVPILNQYIIARLIETSQYDQHIRRLNNIFRKRLEKFYEGFSDVKDKVEISSNGSGQYFLLKFSTCIDQSTLIRKALDNGVRVYSTMQFWQEKATCPPNSLFLGFSKIDLKDIPDCTKRLRNAWAEWL